MDVTRSKITGAEFLRNANASATFSYQEYMPETTQDLAGTEILIRLDDAGEWIRVRFGDGTLDLRARRRRREAEPRARPSMRRSGWATRSTS